MATTRSLVSRVLRLTTTHKKAVEGTAVCCWQSSSQPCRSSSSSRIGPTRSWSVVRRFGSSPASSGTTSATPPPPPAAKSAAGTGRVREAAPGLYERTRDRGPVSWPSLFFVGVAAASAVAYYKIERERRLEKAMGKIVSSESDGWTPRPDYLAKRKFVPTQYGWFPREDGFGARE